MHALYISIKALTIPNQQKLFCNHSQIYVAELCKYFDATINIDFYKIKITEKIDNNWQILFEWCNYKRVFMKWNICEKFTDYYEINVH